MQTIPRPPGRSLRVSSLSRPVRDHLHILALLDDISRSADSGEN